MRIVIDTDTDTFDLFVDGVRKVHDLALRAPASTLSKVRYYMDRAGGTLLVDNVRVYNRTLAASEITSDMGTEAGAGAALGSPVTLLATAPAP